MSGSLEDLDRNIQPAAYTRLFNALIIHFYDLGQYDLVEQLHQYWDAYETTKATKMIDLVREIGDGDAIIHVKGLGKGTLQHWRNAFSKIGKTKAVAYLDKKIRLFK
ncbi:MAG: hypothetical protein H6765_02795 [Candidatus Peribacteria bacterium]|nr:MAG: hypothetical protein H6765_02795 [Candidatus Peribacteria bacterium]